MGASHTNASSYGSTEGEKMTLDKLVHVMIKEIIERWAHHRNCLMHADEPALITETGRGWLTIRRQVKPAEMSLGAAMPTLWTKYGENNGYGGYRKLQPPKNYRPDYTQVPNSWDYESYSTFEWFDNHIVDNAKKTNSEVCQYLDRRKRLRELIEKDTPFYFQDFHRLPEHIKNQAIGKLTEYEKCIMQRLKEEIAETEEQLQQDGTDMPTLKYAASAEPRHQTLFHRKLHPMHLLEEITRLETRLKNADINSDKYVTDMQMNFERRLYLNDELKMMDIYCPNLDKGKIPPASVHIFGEQDDKVVKKEFREEGFKKEEILKDEDGKSYLLLEKWHCEGKGILQPVVINL